MMNRPDAATVPDEIELCVRSLSPTAARERQQAIVGRLEALAERDVVDEVDVSVWGDRIRLDGDERTTSSAVHERMERLRSWAAASGRSLEPVFQRRTGQSSLMGGHYDVLVLPMMGLVEYRDGRVSHVAPSRDGDDLVSVSDRVARLSEAARARQVA